MFVTGIDAHTRYLVVVIVNKSAEKILGPVRVSVAQPERLLTLLAEFRPLEVVVETSSSWPWLHDLLTAAGISFVLAHAKRLRAIAEANYKRDEVDAELLARMRLAGLIPEVYPTPFSQREWATLIRHRATLVAERTALANRIHAQLHRVGLHLERGRLLTRSGRHWLRDTAAPKLGAEQRRLIRTHLRLISQIQVLVHALDRRIAQAASSVPEARLLETVPGIGHYRALLICAEVLPIARFAAPKRLVSYAGLAPRSSKSGQRAVRYGQIPKGCNRWLRGTFVRAVVSHVQHAPDSWLTHFYTEHKQRVGWQVARIAAARKLSRAVHAMLRTGNSWSNVPTHRGEPISSHVALTTPIL
jgi:transposase